MQLLLRIDEAKASALAMPGFSTLSSPQALLFEAHVNGRIASVVMNSGDRGRAFVAGSGAQSVSIVGVQLQRYLLLP